MEAVKTYKIDSRTRNGHQFIDKVLSEILPSEQISISNIQINQAHLILDALVNRQTINVDLCSDRGNAYVYLTAAIAHHLFSPDDFFVRTNQSIYHGYSASAPIPIIISTQTIAKQELVVKRAIPTLSEWLLNAGLIDKPIRSAIRKGKSHYICEENLEARLNNLPRNKSEEYIRKLKNLRTGTPDLDVSKDISNFDKRVICVKQSCKKSCKSYHACRYQAYLRDTSNGNVDFIVCNHNYYLADIVIRRKHSRMLLPMYKAVVVDIHGS